jgi:hypothetical protein
VSQTALIDGIKNGTIKGIPESVTEAQINNFFREVGKDEDLTSADITTLPLRAPLDYTKLVSFINDLLLPLRIRIRKLGLGLNNRDSGSVNAAWLQTSSPHAPLATTSNSTNVTRYTTFRAF